MKVRIEITQAVWERTTAYVTLDEDATIKIMEDYEDGVEGVENYLLDNIDEWMDTADTSYIADVDGMDVEYSTIILDEA